MSVSNAYAVEVFTLLGLGALAIGARTYGRIQLAGIRKLALDDYLMLLTTIPYIAEIVLAYTVKHRFHGLANNAMTDDERVSLPSTSEEYEWRVKGSKVQVAGWAVYVTVLWLIKSSMCAFYSRLTNGLPEYRRRIRWGFILIAVTYLVVLGVILLGCQPLHRLWQIYPDPGNFCQPAISKLLVFLVLTLNVITDAYLLILPIPALRKAQVTRIKRVMLMLLFSGGVFVMAAGILRCVLIIKNPTKGPQQAASWAVRESFVAVVTSSTPVIWGWMKQRLKPLFSSVAILTDPQDSKDAGGMTTLTPTGIQGATTCRSPSAMPNTSTRKSGHWATCAYVPVNLSDSYQPGNNVAVSTHVTVTTSTLEQR